MIDQYGRRITYLRVSVTERCNLRCRYCMPEEGIDKKRHDEMLTEDELIMAIEAAASLGVTKLRITGGEPLMLKNILSICRRAAAVPGIRELCMTTNGTLLAEMAPALREAGVNRLNISIDTLDAEKYTYIKRRGELADFYSGLEAALAAGFLFTLLLSAAFGKKKTADSVKTVSGSTGSISDSIEPVSGSAGSVPASPAEGRPEELCAFTSGEYMGIEKVITRLLHRRSWATALPSGLPRERYMLLLT